MTFYYLCEAQWKYQSFNSKYQLQGGETKPSEFQQQVLMFRALYFLQGAKSLDKYANLSILRSWQHTIDPLQRRWLLLL